MRKHHSRRSCWKKDPRLAAEATPLPLLALPITRSTGSSVALSTLLDGSEAINSRERHIVDEVLVVETFRLYCTHDSIQWKWRYLVGSEGC